MAELAARIRRQVSHLEALEADTEQALRSEAASANWLRVKARLERELQAADRALAMKPDREQAQELVDLLPQLDVDDTLLAEESFRKMLAALDFRATFDPARNDLRMRATLAPELLPVNGDSMSSPLAVPSDRTGRKGRHLPSLFVHVNAAYRIGPSRDSLLRGRSRDSQRSKRPLEVRRVLRGSCADAARIDPSGRPLKVRSSKGSGLTKGKSAHR